MSLRSHNSDAAELILSAEQRAATIEFVASTQQACGSLPWPDGHTDPWDHVESAMALTLGGKLEAARASFEWLVRQQAADGSWASSYDNELVLDATVDTNQCAYIAVGVWHWWLETRDSTLAREVWPTVRAALDFVVSMQRDCGAIAWARSPEGGVPDESLVTGSASTYQALRCGVALGELLGDPQPDWELAAGQLQLALLTKPNEFLDKSRFSMDWYYPVLGGAVTGARASATLRSRWQEFVVAGYGARCVNDRPWVTGAETAELCLALIAIGHEADAVTLLRDVQHLRREDGSYWTGYVFEDDAFWPVEASSWTAAAIVMACDALAGGSIFDLFTGRDLPAGLTIDSAAAPAMIRTHRSG